jgi:uncharacterized protein
VYLVDSNVWLERLLDQEKSEEVGAFLDRVPSDRLLMTDFAFHSIAVILSRLKETGLLVQFVQDAFTDDGIGVVRLLPEETKRVLELAAQFNLDFDDAYQYTAAEKYDLQLVSLDSDFDRTDRGRKAPAEVPA